MKTSLKASTCAALLLGGMAAPAIATAADSPVAGRWDAVLSRNGTDIPFRLDIKGDGPSLQGVFYDGFKPYDGTTSASFQNGNLVLNVDHYLTTINARLDNGQLNGTVSAENRETSANYTFHAVRHVETAAGPAGPSIAGTWIIPLSSPSSKGEKAFRFVVQQNGGEVAGSILRIDGDTGSYTGHFKDGKWVLSHFDGGRPGVIVVTPKGDGTLEIQQESARPAKASSDYGSEAGAPMAAMPPRWSPIVRMSPRPGSGRARRLPQPHQGCRPQRQIHLQLPRQQRQTDLAGRSALQGQGGAGGGHRHLVPQLP
jgi:hypothetical protein